MSLALALGAATGCSSAVAELRSGAATSAATGPVRGGTLRVGVLQDLVAGGVMMGTHSTATLLTGLAFDRLVEYSDGTLTPQPSLATEWTISPDGRRFEFTLRDDVRYHSGRPFTSADAEFSLRAYADPVWTAQLRSTAAAITSFDSSDPHRLVLGLDAPVGNLFDLLSMVPMIDAESAEDLRAGLRYVGTGPFRFAARTPNSRIEFVRNDSYWQPERPYLDGVAVTIVPDASALLSSVRAGQVDISPDLTYRDANNLTRLGGFRVVDGNGAESNAYLGMNVLAPGLSDVRVRRAVALAVDRDRIVDEVYRGSARAASLPWPESSPAYDPVKDRTFTRDVEAARALLDEARRDGDVPAIPLSYSAGSPSYEVIAQIVQADLAEAGLEIRLDPVEYTVAIERLTSGEFPGIWLLQHGFAQYQPSTLTVSAYPFNARRNASNFRSDDYIRIADAAWRIPDGASPDAIARYGELSDALLDSVFLAELAVVTPRTVVSSRVQEFTWNRRGEALLAGTYLS
ncbi:ABC transporter substrate-binding protein [Rhodococcus rhodnii]|nr:ABC transporter substrate-binding protein [Rhodococcus rhodnii]